MPQLTHHDQTLKAQVQALLDTCYPLSTHNKPAIDVYRQAVLTALNQFHDHTSLEDYKMLQAQLGHYYRALQEKNQLRKQVKQGLLDNEIDSMEALLDTINATESEVKRLQAQSSTPKQQGKLTDTLEKLRNLTTLSEKIALLDTPLQSQTRSVSATNELALAGMDNEKEPVTGRAAKSALTVQSVKTSEKAMIRQTDAPHSASSLPSDADKETARKLAFDLFLKNLKGLLKHRGIKRPRCFISYAWEADPKANQQLQARLKQLKNDLALLNVDVKLDISDMDREMESYMKGNIEKSDVIFLIGTPRFKERAHPETKTNLALEVSEALKKPAGALIPLLYQGSFAEAFPSSVTKNLVRDFTDPNCYLTLMTQLDSPMGLIPSLFGLTAKDREYVSLVDTFQHDLLSISNGALSLLSLIERNRRLEAAKLVAFSANVKSEEVSTLASEAHSAAFFPHTQLLLNVEGRADEVRAEISNVSELEADLELVKEATTHIQKMADKGIRNVTHIKKEAVVGNVFGKIGNIDFSSRRATASNEKAAAMPVQPSVATPPQGLFSSSSAKTPRIVVKQAEKFLSDLQQDSAYQDDRDINELGSELKALLESCRSDLKAVNQPQIDQINEKIQEIEDVKAEITPGYAKKCG